MLGITKHILKAIVVMQLLPLCLKAQSIITTIAGSGTPPNNYGYSGDGGQATNAKLSEPSWSVIDNLGNLYIDDAANNVIRKVNITGIITTIAGTGTAGYSGDGGPATNAEFNEPYAIAFDKAGNLYIADGINRAIRKINVSTGIIITIAGNGTAGYSGDGGPATAAEISGPLGIAFDTTGNLYFSDGAGNNVIRKITISTGIITTVVGNGTQGYSGDGGHATAAQLDFPLQVQIDKSNNLYIDDSNNNVIRKVTISTGIISTIVGNGYGAGTGTGGYSGDGGQATAAELYIPDGILLDSLGNLYIADGFNNVIRKVNTAGIIYTLAGTGIAGYSGDGGSPLAAELSSPVGIMLDAHDNLYVVDYGNNRVRKISNVSSITGIAQVTGNRGQLTLYPNPASSMLQVTYTGSSGQVSLYDVLGNELISTHAKEIDVSNLPNGVYFLNVKTTEGVLSKKVVVHH